MRKPGDRFEAFIRPDGEVEFVLDRAVAVKLDAVCAIALCLGGKRENANAAASGGRRRGLGLVGILVGEAALARRTGVGRWGYGAPRNGPAPGTRRTGPPPRIYERWGGLVGRYGHLPAPKAEMSAFMTETLAFRTGLALRDAERQLGEAHENLGRSLAEVWAAEQPVANKRAALLRMWADIDAPSVAHEGELGVSLDRVRGAAAAKARAAVRASVLAHAPQNSTNAFTQAELAGFNAGAAVAFCPYGDAGCPRPVPPSPAPVPRR